MNTSDATANISHVIKRYHDRANQYRMIFVFFRSCQICCAASIPLVSLMASTTIQPKINGILGALIVVVEGLQGTFEFPTILGALQIRSPRARWGEAIV
jgi:Protein of unknown function (DUF4231)